MRVLASIALVVALIAGACSGTTSTVGDGDAVSSAVPAGYPGAAAPPSDWPGGAIPLADIPAEALTTLALIADDGPYPHPQDGSTFQNREGILPDRASGFYREFTVETPGSPDRGARRLVMGDDGAVYYTDDHYDSFRFVRP